jgi:hypothetical protein
MARQTEKQRESQPEKQPEKTEVVEDPQAIYNVKVEETDKPRTDKPADDEPEPALPAG